MLKSVLKLAILITASGVAGTSKAQAGFGTRASSFSTQVFTAPSPTSMVVGELPATSRLTRMVERSSDGLWQRSNGPNVQGWIRTADLSKGVDMRKVVGCWPFKQVHPAAGEATFDHIDFSLDGRAVLVDVYGKRWRSQVFIKDALVWVRPNSNRKSAPFGEFLRYSQEKRTLEPGAEKPTGFTIYDDESLRGCKGIVTGAVNI